MQERILITGGLGFLGQHLARYLLRTDPGCQLTIVDNVSSSKINYEWLHNRAEILTADFKTVALAHRRFSRIYHLASPVGSLGILARSGYLAKEITDLATRAGELAADQGAALLYVSSSEVYGKAGLQQEDDELSVPVQTGTRMEYSLGKLAAEHLLLNLAARFGFRLTVVRPFNALGEGQSAQIGFVVPTFFQNALAGKPLPLFNGGHQVRCFCHAEDVARGLVAVQERGKGGHTYNLGNPGNAVTIRDLAIRIRELCASDSQFETVDPAQRFGAHYLEASAKSPRIDKIRDHTGWTPVIDLDTALTRVYNYYATVRVGKPCTSSSIGSLRINISSRDNALDLIRRSVQSPGPTSASLGFLNPHVYNLCVTHPTVATFLQRCDAVCLDGIGATIAASLFARAWCDRVIMHQLFDFSIASGLVQGPVVLFGLSPEEITHAARELRRAAPMADFVAVHHGFHQDHEYQAILRDHADASFVLVGASSPRSERILMLASEICHRALCWHVGAGTLKQWAGTKHRAPAVVAQLGLEWLHRMSFEPHSRSRYTTGIPLFVRHLLSATPPRATGETNDIL